jgi:hypothetical protein
MVQEEGPRREHRPRPRVLERELVGSPGRRSRPSATTGSPRSAGLQPRDARRLLRGDRLRRGQRPAGRRAARRASTTPRSACRRSPPGVAASTGGVRVKGVGDLLVRFAKCCHPIPGDPIVGFITRARA